MTGRPDWWQKPRRIVVIIDNPSWILPIGERLVGELNGSGDIAILCRSHEEVPRGDVAFYLGCLKITPPEVLARNRRNLIVHESDLPRGRGFSPLTWQVIEGQNEIPICLFEATEDADAGLVIYRERLRFAGHEIIDELRKAQGEKTLDICLRFLAEPSPPEGEPQRGAATYYARRQPADSRLDPERSIAEQFDLLRTVDNVKYPAFFDHRGHRYKLAINMMPKDWPSE